MPERERVRSGPGLVALVIGLVLAAIGLAYIGWTVVGGMRGRTPVPGLDAGA